MRKAVAVPYIIAILLGVAVIGLVGYWYASTGGKFGAQASKTICDNKFLQWCLSSQGVTFATHAPECVGVVSYSDCSELTVGSGGGGGPGCGCTGWTNVACGTSPCIGTQMKQTRSCTPPACNIETQCISDPSCGGGPPPGCISEGACTDDDECCDNTCQFFSC